MTSALAIDFRGDRDYLHGTDLYSAIHSAFLRELGVEELQSIRLKIPCFFSKPVSLEIRPGKSEDSVWRCSARNQLSTGILREDVSAAAPGRRPFDEDTMIKAMKRTGPVASLAGPRRWSAIEEVVFLGKFLNHELNPLAAEKQWVFTQLELERSLRDGEEIAVRQESLLSGFFSRSSVLVQGARVGSIDFAKIDRASRQMEGLG